MSVLAEDHPTWEEENEDETISSFQSSMASLELPKLPNHETIEKCCAMTLKDIYIVDTEIVEKGLNLLFSNHFTEAEALFRTRMTTDPLCAGSIATLYAIKAILSVEQEHISVACIYLLYASHFSKRVISQNKGAISCAISGVSSLFGSRQPSLRHNRIVDFMSPAAFRARIVMAEAEVVRGIILLLEHSITSYLKAGLALRRSYNIYDGLQKQLDNARKICLKNNTCKGKGVELVDLSVCVNDILRDVSGDKCGESNKSPNSRTTPPTVAMMRYGVDIDNNSYFGMHFGLGCIHIATSIMPPKILNLLKSLGYMHDRELGFKHLDECLKSMTIRSQLARLFLLSFHGALPSFSSLMVPLSLGKALRVVEESRGLYDGKSVIHMWLSGRVMRLRNAGKGLKLSGPVPGEQCGKDLVISSNSSDNYYDLMSPEMIFKRCIEDSKESSVARALPQMRHFAIYDLAWTLCSNLKWREAIDAFSILERENEWSKSLYAYAQGACFEMLAVEVEYSYAFTSMKGHQNEVVNEEEAMSYNDEYYREMASKCYWRCLDHRNTKVGGKIISIDQFVRRRVERMVAIHNKIQEISSSQTSSNSHRRLPAFLSNTTINCAALELCLLFNIIPQMEDWAIHRALLMVIVAVLEHPALHGAIASSPEEYRGCFPTAAAKGKPNCRDVSSLVLTAPRWPAVWDIIHKDTIKASDSNQGDEYKVSAGASPPSPSSIPVPIMPSCSTLLVSAGCSINAHIKEDIGAILLLVGTLSREAVRTADSDVYSDLPNGKGCSDNRGRDQEERMLAVDGIYKKIWEPLRGASLLKAKAPNNTPTVSLCKDTNNSDVNNMNILQLVDHCCVSYGRTSDEGLGYTQLSQLFAESWVLPVSMYESGILYFYCDHFLCSDGDAGGLHGASGVRSVDRSKKLYEEITCKFKGKDYNFEMQMQLRIHLGSDALRNDQ